MIREDQRRVGTDCIFVKNRYVRKQGFHLIPDATQNLKVLVIEELVINYREDCGDILSQTYLARFCCHY